MDKAFVHCALQALYSKISIILKKLCELEERSGSGRICNGRVIIQYKKSGDRGLDL